MVTKFNLLLYAFLVILAFSFLIFEEYYAALVVLLCIGILTAAMLVLDLSKEEILGFLILIYLEIFGERFGFNLYEQFLYYDKVLHFLFFFVATFFVCTRLEKYGLKKHLFLFTFFVCLGMGALWEIVEYTMDLIFGSGAMMGVFDTSGHSFMVFLDDTMWDMILGAIGSLVAFTFILRHQAAHAIYNIHLKP